MFFIYRQKPLINSSWHLTMVKIQHINPSNLDNAVNFLRKGGEYDASRVGNEIHINNSIVSEPFYKPFRIVHSGIPQRAEIGQIQSLLSKHPWHSHLDLKDLKNNFATKFPRDRDIGFRLNKLQIPFFYAHPSQISQVIDIVAPYLSEYGGIEDVWFIYKSNIIESRLAVMRILHAAKDMPEIIGIPVDDFGGFQTLEKLQSTSSLGISRELGFCLSLFTPALLGTTFDQIGGTYVFILKNPKEYTVPYPPRLQDMLSPHIYTENKRYSEKIKFKTWTFSSDSVGDLVQHFAARLSDLHAELLNPINYADASGVLDARRWHLTYSTTSRLFIDGTLAQTEYLNQYLRKIMVFRSIDSVAQLLSEHSPGGRSESEIFQYLCRRDVFLAKFTSESAKFPKPFGNLLRNWGHSAINELYDKLLAGVFVPGRRIPGKIRVGTTDIPEDDYVPSFLREVRNTQHGYNIRKFPVLQIHNGNIPDCLGDISKFIILAYLQRPDLILKQAIFT